jgi:hypothetical protein
MANLVQDIGIPAGLAGIFYIALKIHVLDDLVKTTAKIKANVKVISDHLIQTSTDFNHTELQSYSPLNLTKEGEKLLTDLGFQNVYEANRDDFLRFIDSEHPKLKYDVELSAIKAVSALSDMEYMNFLKVFFYNNPSRNMQNTAPTLGVYLRDKYLEAHPEITQ